MVTAHAGALDGAAGVLLIAGTGAVALGVDPSGARLVDGWGPELGDFGSGSWLGREALRAVLRAHDGLAAPTALTAALAAP
ncbi:BadF/BadG/BcrA/BcrD ATPase family protein, partial [Microbacterium sp. K36]|uniref:BadF/BadG/BcrA/BcrD ATPase family protein n=1 Tax=Microbacterium sp. K36 TaxID=2305439 RepID=UPI0023AB1ED2